jgi:hypothetical protein
MNTGARSRTFDKAGEGIMTIAQGVFEWDIQDVSDALKIGVDDVMAYFTDGRRVSFLLERRIAYEVLHGTLAPSRSWL